MCFSFTTWSIKIHFIAASALQWTWTLVYLLWLFFCSSSENRLLEMLYSHSVYTMKGHVCRVKCDVHVGPLCHIGSRTVQAGRYQKGHSGHCYSSFGFSKKTPFFFSNELWVELHCIKTFFSLPYNKPEGLLQKPRVPENSIWNSLTWFKFFIERSQMSCPGLPYWCVPGFHPSLVLLTNQQIQFLLFPFSLPTFWAPFLVPNLIPHLHLLMACLPCQL